MSCGQYKNNGKEMRKKLPFLLINELKTKKRTRALEVEKGNLKSLWLVNTRAKKENIYPNPTQWKELKTNYKGLLDAVYGFALTYVEKNRPENEKSLFCKLFNRETWTSENIRCFISLYEAGKQDGINEHSDWVSFCTVTVCLQGGPNSGKGLVVGTGKQEEQVNMETGYMYAYGRYPHRVDSFKRKEDRCTLNFFF